MHFIQFNAEKYCARCESLFSTSQTIRSLCTYKIHTNIHNAHVLLPEGWAEMMAHHFSQSRHTSPAPNTCINLSITDPQSGPYTYIWVRLGCSLGSVVLSGSALSDKKNNLSIHFILFFCGMRIPLFFEEVTNLINPSMKYDDYHLVINRPLRTTLGSTSFQIPPKE